MNRPKRFRRHCSLLLSFAFLLFADLAVGQFPNNHDIYVVDVKTGVVSQVSRVPNAGEFNPSWSNDGKQIAHDVVGGPAPLGHAIYITDVQTGVSNLTEPNETFFVNLTNPTNATIADNQGQGTVRDDDPPPLQSITLNPTADAQVRSNYPTNNYGKVKVLAMKQPSSVIFNSYLKFAVSGVIGSVVSAKLRLTVTAASNSGGSVYFVADNSWTEAGINYNNAPPISGTPLDTVGSVTVG